MVALLGLENWKRPFIIGMLSRRDVSLHSKIVGDTYVLSLFSLYECLRNE